MITLLSAAAIATFFLGLAVVGARLASSYRRTHPYKVICRNVETGMVAVRWRDEPHRTRWVSPASLQKGLHR